MNIMKWVYAIILVTGIVSCKKEFTNPNAAEFPPKTSEGMIQLMVGIKYRFAINGFYGGGALFNGITADGFTTNQLALKAGANFDFTQLAAGKNNIASTNQVLTELWSNCLLINSQTSYLIDNVDRVANDPATNISIKKYAYLYKALSIGTLANYWKSFPVTTGNETVFTDRAEALGMAISLLEAASELPDTYSVVPELGTEINLKNTINAIMARYHLMLQQSDQAIEKALMVDPSSKSVFIYNAQNPNPVYRSGYTAGSGYTPKQTPQFGLPASLAPDSADKRIPTYLAVSAAMGYGFGKTDADPIPVYLPGEMLLIQAESYVRKGDLVNGKKFLDSVLRKTSAEDVFGIGAGLPGYTGLLQSDSLLQEIYKNRCIELFLSGMKMEDGRRFNRPGPADQFSERTRDFYPYPMQERNGNPNTPPDPQY